MPLSAGTTAPSASARLPASLIFGWLWQRFGVAAAFGTGAGLAGLAALLLWLLVPETGGSRPVAG